MIRYVWRDGQGDDPGLAQKVGERLNELEKQYGEITPELVLDDARSANSLLHRFFTWDDSQAAHAHRLWQARQLIGRVHVRIIEDGKDRNPVRAFINLKKDDGQSYTNTVSALSDEFKRAQILKRARDELIGWRNRYDDLQEFAGVVMAIDQATNNKAKPRTGRRA
jgi:hypothetical protein